MQSFVRLMSLSAISAARPRATPLKPLQIHLTEVEEKLCDLLTECTEHIKQQDDIETSCRFAGGWVRDKLLGLQSNDIDVAVSDMTGLTFANYLSEFVKSHKDIPMKDHVTVEANPEQSKHLETARTAIWGLEIDLVNLRSEGYAENSRIPTQITFGTPLIDAMRRDTTMNALFYNVRTRAVEDHTGRGLQDLETGSIRTPLPPRETFLDDPLRVIRAIRFASRFGFNLVEELRDSAKDPAIQSALIQKISRDRVGEELDKMMKGRDPLHSIQLINELSLYRPIFYTSPSHSSTFSAAPADFEKSLIAAIILHEITESTILSLSALHPALKAAFTSLPSIKPRLYLASALTPYKNLTYTDHKKKVHPVTELVLREGVKLGAQNHYLDGIPTLFAAAEILKNPSLEEERFTNPSERVAIGLVLRDKLVHNPNVGSTWQISLLFSLVQELIPFWTSEDIYDAEGASKCIEKYNKFVSRVEELGLSEVGDMKPIINGKEVVEILSAKPGPWTGQVLAKVVEWQLGHPQGTKEECSDWLVSENAAGRVSVVFERSPQKRVNNGDTGISKKAKR